MIPLGDYNYYLKFIKNPIHINQFYFMYNIPNNNNPWLFCVPSPVNFLEYWVPNSEETFKYGFMDPKEKKIFSQDGTDGVLEFIFSNDVLKPNDKFYVELGTEDGTECNSRNLRETHGWNGLMVDGGNENEKINLQKHFITKENIIEIFEKNKINKSFDLLSIDLDGNDFYILNEILNHYSPRVIVAEYNGYWLPNEDKIIKYDPEFIWDHNSNYSGMTILSLYKLGKHHGYSLVYATSFGTNAFLIKNSELNENIKGNFKFINEPENIYKRPKYGVNPHKGHPSDEKHREYLNFDKAIN